MRNTMATRWQQPRDRSATKWVALFRIQEGTPMVLLLTGLSLTRIVEFHMIIMIGQGLAVCAGFCAAMAAVSAKLAMTSETTLGLCNLAMNLIAEVITPVYDIDWQRAKGISARDLLPACDTVLPFVRLVFLGLIFAFNAIMWTLFVKSLQKCSSIEATVTNTASNFFFTAVMGHVLFGETLSLMWWAGASLIIVGLLLVHKGSRSKDDSADKKKTL